MKGEFIMSGKNSISKTQNNKKEDGNFKKKNISHDPKAESAKALHNEVGIR